jgi:purine catabolism regulator
MSLSLRELLTDPTLADADPVVHAGHDRMSEAVRWVHTSEVLDIASLLRGGELLLVGGASLAGATEEERRRYVTDLAERGVAGLALETGTRLSAIPPEMVEEARRLDFPLVELHAVVRFVEVTQAINGTLVNASVRQLQLSDRVSHALAAGLADGADILQLLGVLARVTHARVSLVTPGGELIGEAGLETDSPTPVLAATPVTSAPISAPVSSAGVTVAILTLVPGPDSDLLTLQAARDRAPEALGLALLRWRPLSQLEQDSHDFLSTALRGGRPPRRLVELAVRLGIDEHDAWFGVVGKVGEGRGFTGAVDTALHRTGRMAVTEMNHDGYVAVVGVTLGADSVPTARQRLIEDLRDTPLPLHLHLAVGPGVRELDHVGRSLREAGTALDLAGDQDRQAVHDALALGVPRLLATVNRPSVVAEFVEEQIGDVLAADRRRGTHLFDTLATYLRRTGNKTETAQALHLQRQSLYQRLDRVMALLGHPAPGSPRWGAIMVAVELEQAQREGGRG